MQTITTKTAALLGYAPLLLGLAALLLAAAYHCQRGSLFLRSFYSLDSAIQHHLDAIAFCAVISAIAGIVVGFVVRRLARLSRPSLVGMWISAAALLWSTLFLSL